MKLKEIREDYNRNRNEGELNFKEMVAESLRHIEIPKFKRKGKIDYVFSNETVEI